MPKYKFTWEFEVDNEVAPTFALLEAWNAMREEDSTASLLTMHEIESGKEITLDFEEIRRFYINGDNSVTLLKSIEYHIGDTFNK